jgi:hypothetical protein
MALSKFNFNSFDLTTVASTGLAFNSSANGFDTAAAGAMTLIATNTISSGVSSSSFTSGIDSTYDTYLFKFINMHPATDDVFFQVNFRDGSSAFDATKTTTLFGAYHGEGGGGASVFYDSNDDLAQSTGYQKLTTDSIGNGNDESLSGEMYLFSPSNTTFVKHFIARTNIYHDGDYTFDNYIAGYCNVTAAIDGVDFQFNSGNVDSGVIKMYGITK